jgi:hypothetical protein
MMPTNDALRKSYVPFLLLAAIVVVGALCWPIVHPERPLEQARANDDVGSRQRTVKMRLPGATVFTQFVPDRKVMK